MINFIISDDDINNNLEICYIILGYILNSVKNKKSLLQNIILNFAEIIHISLLTGQSSVKYTLKLFTYLLNKNDIILILSELGPTITRVFTEIFVEFTPMHKFLQRIKLDYIIISGENEINSNDNEIDIFKDLSISSKDLDDNFDKIKNENKFSFACYKDLIKIIVNIRLKFDDNKNKIIYKSFKKYIKTQKKLIKSDSDLAKYRLNNILKTFIIPTMSLFNNDFNNMNDNDKKSVINYWIKKFENENNTKEEFLGGTFKYVKDQYAKNINNFEEITKTKNNTEYKLFLFEIIDFLFNTSIFGTFFDIIKMHTNMTKDIFLNTVKNETPSQIISSFMKYFYSKINLFTVKDYEIIINFFDNFICILLDVLYPNNLIYFLNDNVLLHLSSFVELLYDICSWPMSGDTPECISNKKVMLFDLIENCIKNSYTLFCKIIDDNSIKKIDLKYRLFFLVFPGMVYKQYILKDEQFFIIFNFMNSIHNNPKYNNQVSNIMDVIGKEVISKNGLTELGKRLQILFKIKGENNLLRTVLILIYSYINQYLSKLEEVFTEYNFQSTVDNKNTNNNINNNRNVNIINPDNNINNNDNNTNDNNRIIILENNSDNVNGILLEILQRIIEVEQNPNNQGNSEERNPIIFRDSNNQEIVAIPFRIPLSRPNISQLNDKEKLKILEKSFHDISKEFLKLIYFYKLAENESELYDSDTFENKFLNNLLISLYNIIFSPNNYNKIKDEDVMISYLNLLTNLLEFYNLIFENIKSLKNENILKEFAKKRNLYHLKEILLSYNKLFNGKYKEKNIINNEDLKYFNNFINNLEQIVPEEDTIKNIIDSNSNSSTKIKKNICPICADSVIDTHILPCEHSICRNCLIQCLSENKICPFCRVKVIGIKEDKNFKV